MASIYRRKQDAILGLDNSSFISTSDSLANEVARHRAEPSNHNAHSLRRKQGVTAAARSKQVENDVAVSRMDNSRDYARSLYDSNNNNNIHIEDDYEVSDLEDSDEDERLRGRRPSKANHLLGLDTRGGISSKAQKLLGMSKPHNRSPEHQHQIPQRQGTVHSVTSDSDSIAPKALRMLGMNSGRFSRPATAHERSPQYAGPYDVKDFKRSIPTSSRNLHGGRDSSTDVSTLSRESTISWKTETPRSSQEVHMEDMRWHSRQSNFTKRQDSLYDSNAVLTEPFSPLSVDAPFGKAAAPESPASFSFELPAHVPIAYYGPEKAQFLAELPGVSEPEPIFEMPVYEAEIAELPAEVVELPADEQLGIQCPNLPELDSGSPPRDSHTRAAGGSSSLKNYPYLRQNDTSQTRAASLPRNTIKGSSPTSADVMNEPVSRPTVVGLQTRLDEFITRARRDEALSRSRSVDSLNKFRSGGFHGVCSSIPETPISPMSPNSGLGAIAARAAVSRRRNDSVSETHSMMARSKFNPDLFQMQADSPPAYADIMKHVSAQVQDHDLDQKVNLVTKKVETIDIRPDSSVMGHFILHPAFREQSSSPEEELIFLKPGEMLMELQVPPRPLLTDEPVADSPTIPNLRKQGFI